MSEVNFVFSEDESNKTAAAPTNVACPKCGGTKPSCCSCRDPASVPSSEPVSLKDGGAAICPQCGYDPAKWVTIGTIKVDIENETETFIPATRSEEGEEEINGY